MNIRIINSSKFTDFEICPALFSYRNIEKYNEILFSSTEETKRGDLIHSIIDSGFKGISFSEKFMDTMDEKIKSWWKFYLENYHLVYPETLSEWSFNLPLKTPHEKVILTGRIDRFTRNGNKITIFDWKTTSKKSVYTNLTHNLQMDFYAYCLSKIMNAEIIESKVVYLELKHEDNRIIDREKLNLIEEKILNMVKKTHPEIKIYAPNPLYLSKEIPYCKICHFFSQCENYL